MPKPKEPEYDRDTVIKRLIAEQTQTSKTLDEIRKVIYSDPEFEGLTLIGGVKAILRRYKEEQEKNLQLDKELNLMMRGGKRN